MGDFFREYSPYIIALATYVIGRMQDISSRLNKLRYDVDQAHGKIRRLENQTREDSR